MKRYILPLLLSLSVYPLKSQTFYTVIDDDAASVNAIYEIKRIADKKNIKIDKAIEKGDWLVFFTHNNMPRDFSPEYLEEVISYCQYKNLPCLTVDEAYYRLTPYKGHSKIKEWGIWDEVLLQIEMHIWYLLTASIMLLFGILFIYFKKK